MRRSSRFRSLALPLALFSGAALLAVQVSGSTLSQFSSSAVNPGNSFSAASGSSSPATVTGAVVKSSAGSATYPSTVLAGSPVGYWRLGEATGATTAVDASGAGNHGTYAAGGPALGIAGTVGDGNTAARWTGTSSPVSVPHATALNLAGSFTVELWMRIESYDTVNFVNRNLLYKASNSNNGYRLFFDNTRTLTWEHLGTAYSTPTGSFAPGRFNHVVLAYNGTALRWYVDGSLVATTTASLSAVTGTFPFSMTNTTLDDTELLTLDEVALYPSALSATAVSDHYNTGRMLMADPCSRYRVYANVTRDGSPATGVTSVTANLGTLTPGGTAVPLTAGSYSVGGTTYGYQSAPLSVGVQPGSYSYSVTWTDGSGTSTQNGLTATVDQPRAVTTKWVTGFGHGATQTPDLFSAAQFDGTSMVVTSPSRGSADSLEVSRTTTTAEYAAKNGFTTTTSLFFALRLATLPTADVTSLAYFNMSSTPLYLGYQAATQKLTLRWGANGAVLSSATVAAGTWYPIDLKVDVSANPNTASWRVDGIDQASVSLATAAQTVTDFRLGSAVAADRFTANYDDVVQTSSLSDYPLGPLDVKDSLPDGMSTHNNPDRFVNSDGTAITANSYQLLDDPAMTNTADGIRMDNNLFGLNAYIGLTTADTSSVCVVGAQAVSGQHREAGTGTNNTGTRVVSGTTETVVSSGDSGGTTIQHRTMPLAPVSAPWSQSEFNALVFRIGFTGDNTPRPHWDALLIEYAVPSA